MRILAIRGKNLASLAKEFEVLLETGSLQKVGLFAITGATGAGKSTILDALCLALYDQMPRLPEGHGVAVGHKDDVEAMRVKSHDVASILRRGTASAYAEVDFIGQDKQRYRARWELSRARNKVDGRLQAQRMSLMNIDTQVKIGQAKKDTQQEIIKRLGLNFEQFRRSVLLAQGDFAAFLKAKKDERASLLEKITGTDIYSELSIAAFERAKLEKLQLARIQEKLADKVPLEAADRAELEAELARLAEQLSVIQQQQQAKQLILDWFTQLAKLTAERNQAQQQFLQKQASWESEASQRELLAQVMLVQPLRPLLQHVLASRADYKEAQTQCSDSAAELLKSKQAVSDAEQRVQTAQHRFVQAETEFKAAQPILILARALDTKIENGQARLQVLQQEADAQQERWQTADAKAVALGEQDTQLQQQLQQLQIWQAQHSALQDLANEWGRWESDIQDYLEQQQALQQQQAKYEQLQHSMDTQQAELNNLQKGAAVCLAQEQQLNVDLQALEQQADAQALADLYQQQATLESRQAISHSAVTLAEQGLALQQELASTQAAITASEQALQQAHTQIEQLNSQQAYQQGQLQEAQQAFNRMQAAGQKTARDLRALLLPEEPCPVCGAQEHPWANKHLEALEASVTAQQARVEQLMSEKEQLLSALSAQQSIVKQAQQEQERLVQAVRRMEASLQVLAEQWLSFAFDDKPAWAALQSVDITRLQTQKAQLNVQYQAIKNQVAEALSLQTQMDALRRQRDTARQQAAQQDANIAALDKKIAQQVSTLAAYDERITELKASLLKLETGLRVPLQAVDNWQTELSSAGDEFLQQLRDSVAKWHKNNQQQNQLKQELVQIKQDLAVATTAAEQQQQHHQQLQQTLQQHKRQQQDLFTERQQYCQGRSASAYAQELELQLQTAAQQKQQADADKVAANHALSTWQSTQQHWQAEQQRRLEKQDAAEQALQAELAQLQLTQERAQDLLQKDAQWISAQEQKNAALTQALQEAQADLKIGDTHLQAHQQQAPAVEEEQVIAELAQLHREQKALNAARENKVFLQRVDDEKIAAAQHLQAELKQQLHLYEQWESLNELIGSKTGHKFRIFAQSLTLDTLLSYTNRHLQEFAKRYILQRVPDSELELQVIDRDMADDVRSIHSLSGGESFLVALALALGLASLSSNQTQVESLFIDEGFGSLDQETLDIALASLDTLQSLGRKVGVISHVPALVERIGAQVVVAKLGGGQSVVTIKA